MQDQKKHEMRRMTEFGTIGAIVAVLSFAQLWLYIDIMGMLSWLAYIVQTIVSVQLSFWQLPGYVEGPRATRQIYESVWTLLGNQRGDDLHKSCYLSLRF